jgi:homeobox protein cut-like
VFYPDISLSELQKTLDAQGIELVDNQKESLVGRKALADKTKGKEYFMPTLGF